VLLGLGPVLGVVVLGIGAPHQSRAERAVLGGWLTATTAPWHAFFPPGRGTVALPLSVACLVALWLAVAWQLAHRPVPARLAVVGTALWGLPFALGAPFLSRDVYAYAAQGEVLRQGLDPYRVAPSVLGNGSAVLQAVDPMWRSSRPPYGPLALQVEGLAARLGSGHVWVTLAVLRLVAVVGVVVAVAVVRRAAPVRHRALVPWLAASPLVLLQLVAAAHLEALLGALLVVAVVLAVRGHLAAAIVVATLATQVKATAAVVVGALLLHACLHAGRHRAVRLAGLAALTFVGSAVLLFPRDPFGWVHALGTPTAAWNPFTPSSTLYLGLGEVATRLGVDLPDATRTACRVLVAAVGAAVLVAVARRARHRDAAWTAAAVLAVTSLAAPVVWPWYLAPAALLLLLAGRPAYAAAVGAAPALTALTLPVVHAQRVGIAAELVAVTAVGLWLVARRTGRGPGWLHAAARDAPRLADAGQPGR
jgi:hypothetical protein